MATERVRLLLAELLKEPGVSGVLLTDSEQTGEIQLVLKVADTIKVQVQALFGPDGKSDYMMNACFQTNASYFRAITRFWYQAEACRNRRRE